MALATRSPTRFNPGQVVMTQGVNDLVQRGVIDPRLYLLSFQVTATIKLWIITERDRSVTTLLLPDEY